ncbi:MAG: hypothetical protein AB1696_04960 [Planctomycetota bacterium]
MGKIKNPQEFFEVFKGPELDAQKGQKPAAPQQVPVAPPKTLPSIVRPTLRPRYAEVEVTPGTITVTFSHTGLVLAMALLALLLILSFWFGMRHALRPRGAPQEGAKQGEPTATVQGEEPSMDRVPALDMTPPSKAAAVAPTASPTEKPAESAKQGKGYCLQLISAIPKEKAEEIAKSLSVNWDTEVVRTGKAYGVRIGYWSSPNETAARHALAYFEKQKEYKGCYFIKVER